MEAALQAHLTHAGLEATEASGAAEGTLGGRGPPPDLVSPPLAVLGAALASQPALTVEGMMAQCVALEAPLTLRVLLSLQLTLADGSSVTQTSSTVWMPAAIRSVRAAALCRVSPAREFELLPLWFFVVELVAHEAWLLEYSAAAEALQSFSKAVQSASGLIGVAASFWESLGRDAPPPLQTAAMQLAARAALLYLNHAVLAKARGRLALPVTVRFGDASPELQAQAAALSRCASQPAYRSGFDAFFGAIARLLASSAPVPLAEYRREVVRTLLPMAPYLQGL